ncbi:type III PLP-dependent enzyme [Sphingomonas sp. KR1UV-12]|uniref:ornithine decarboxylase n=1 Tax=Sphingomonas aurea TaxID=3063994 RepID=A0ABT9EGA4_9SPHN|nr:type III PLP-dependent enzyme [Sphingomonas sp. KR1UV-12]MDP1026001.1 type III PLP-dependent enzyme [Sphingomonas sp. KR1UV-12]
MHKHHRALGLAPQSTARSVAGLDIAKRKPVDPVTLVRPHAAARAARFFVEKFPGRSMYAVKANPSPDLLRILWDNGISHYDTASIAEVRLVKATLPDATCCFMHPVKSPEAIAEAYFDHGVRTFSLDSLEELAKIVAATDGATDLTLCVRMRVSSEYAKLSLGSKFGVGLDESKELLIATRQVADALGICFHVGSQTMSPDAYSNAMERVRAAIVDAAVTVDVIDVGGGFPSAYPGMTPPPLERFFETIHRAFESLPVSYSAELWAEPGRALCAEYSSVVVRVERRRGAELFINDGAYGTLFDAAHIGWKYPVQLLRTPDSSARDMDFAFWGPTCDDLDYMKGPFPLPADVQAGDYFEIGMLGAYGIAMRTQFNGFGTGDTVVATDEAMLSVYLDDRQVAQGRTGNVVKL